VAVIVDLWKRLPSELIDKLRNCMQNPKYHAEGSVWNHILLVSNLLPDELNIQACVLFHDLGKIDTHRCFEKDGVVKIQHIGHENYVGKYIREYQHLFSDLDIDWEMVYEVGYYHMLIHKYVNGDLKKPHKREFMENLQYFDELKLFTVADDKGRIIGNGRPYLIITFGIPGSGKTRWATEFCQKSGFARISPDDLRREITGDVSDQTQNGEVWKRAFHALKENIANGISTVFDATNVSERTRKSLETIAGDQAIVIYKIFNCGVFEGNARIQNDIRNKVDRADVPMDVILKMNAQYNEAVEYIRATRIVMEVKE
jgi:predicted kinase